MEQKDTEIQKKLNDLFNSDLFKENNYLKIYKLLHQKQESKPTKPTKPTEPETNPELEIKLTHVKTIETANNDIIVVFVRVNFENDNKKKFSINEKYNILKNNLDDIFQDLKRDDLYKKDKGTNYVKFFDNNVDQTKYIICIEPDFTADNDDTTELINDLFDILTNIYNTIIIIYKTQQKNNNKLNLKLSIPSIIDNTVSIINKKIILGCFSKIYKENYKKYGIEEKDFEDKELLSYFKTLI